MDTKTLIARKRTKGWENMRNAKKIEKEDIKDVFDKPFPKLLRELRQKDKLSQENIAKETSVSRQSIGNYELGTTSPDIYSAKEIVDFFNKRDKLNYTIEDWMGEENVAKGTKRKELPLSNESIEILKEYKKDDYIIVALEILLKQRTFFEKLAKYIVYANMNELIMQDDTLSKFVECEKIKIHPRVNKKYLFYDVQEELPILKKYSEEEIRERIKTDESILYEYVDVLIEENYHEMLRGMEEDYRINEEVIEEYKKMLLCEPKVKKIVEKYKTHRNGKEKRGEYNVRSRTRNGKKV